MSQQYSVEVILGRAYAMMLYKMIDAIYLVLFQFTVGVLEKMAGIKRPKVVNTRPGAPQQ